MPSQPLRPTPAPILPDPGDKETFSARKLAHMKWTNDSSPIWDDIGQKSYQNALESIDALNDTISARDESFDARDKSIAAKNQSVDAKDMAIAAKDEAIKAAGSISGQAIWNRFYDNDVKKYRLRPSDDFEVGFLDMRGKGPVLISDIPDDPNNFESDDYFSAALNANQIYNLINKSKNYKIESISTNSGSFQLQENNVYLASANSVYTIKLPINPEVGQWIVLINISGNWSNQNIKLQPYSNHFISAGNKSIKGNSIVFDSDIPYLRLTFVNENTWACM